MWILSFDALSDVGDPRSRHPNGANDSIRFTFRRLERGGGKAYVLPLLVFHRNCCISWLLTGLGVDELLLENIVTMPWMQKHDLLSIFEAFPNSFNPYFFSLSAS